MNKRTLLILGSAVLPLCAMHAFAQQGHGSARDAFWSASDLVSVTPNPAAHHSAAPRRPRPSSQGSTTSKSTDDASGEEVASAGDAGRPKSALQLVSENGYGAAPHLIRTSESRLGLRYSILLRGADGQYAEVRPGTTFHSGDHIRLSLMSNEPGYLYVIQQGSSGSWSPLFPPAGAGADSNKIEQGKLQQVPSATKTFILNEPAGEEKLFVVLSQTPIADLDHVIQGLKGDAPASPPDSAGPMLEAQNRIPDVFVQQMASRDLALVDEEQVDASATASHSAEKAVYVVSKKSESGQDTQVVAKIVLHHE